LSQQRLSAVPLFLLLMIPPSSIAAQALVATATNFTNAAEYLSAAFEASSEHRILITSGSTGKLYAQIMRGAPFDILLAADQRRPELLEQGGGAIAGSRFTYAIGRLVLWAPRAGTVGEERGMGALREARRLAMANPDLAPYGAAAMEALIRAGLEEVLRARIVMGENVAQAYAMVASGNADMGLVALSLIKNRVNSDNWWLLSPTLYDPIRQDAVLLTHGEINPAALAFLDYLKTAEARALIERLGFSTINDD